MTSIAEATAKAMDGIADLLATTQGLRPADGWTVCSGPVDPLPSTDVVLFGDVTIPQSPAGLGGREGVATWNGWVVVFRPGAGETATREARRVAAEAMGRIEGALKVDPTAGGMAMQGSLRVASSGVLQSLAEWNGQAGQQARIGFQIAWTSYAT